MIHHRWPVQRPAQARTRADQNPMLICATRGMLAYGLYSVARGLLQVCGGATLAWWAILGLVLLGEMLIFAALPGGCRCQGASRALGAMLEPF